jgi:Uma2 family endonuclease
MGPYVAHAILDAVLDPKELAPEAPRLITRLEFERLGQTDFFGDDERVELIRGVLVTPPMPHPRHEAVIVRLNRLLILALGKRAWVQVNAAYAADDYSQVLPDLAVIPDGDYETERPASALLVVEVALSSLRKDQRVKAPLYAENGVPEYWIVNVDERLLEVHTLPRDGRYTNVATMAIGQTVRLVKFPDVAIDVADVFTVATPGQ